MSGDVVGLWGQAVSYLNQRDESDRYQLGVYLSFLTPETLSENELIVSTGNSFAKNWIEQHGFLDIKDAIYNVSGADLGFRIIFSDKDASQKTVYQQMYFSETPEVVAHYSPLPQTKPSFHKPTITTDECTFESFVVGDSNLFAYSTALGVAKSPGNIYNPVFIYGNSGLGKTHLLLAIENYIKVHNPFLKTMYVQASAFVRDFYSKCFNDDKRKEFDLKYWSVDVLLLDDVQYLEGKVETTNEVFQILNEFTTENKQVVLSADRPPYSIAIDERYTSRFASGPTVDIQPPNYETKFAIFENYFNYFCQRVGRDDLCSLLSQEIIDHVVTLSSDNIRELNGAAKSLVAYFSCRDNRFGKPKIEEIEKQILNVFMKGEEKRITVEIIQKEVELFYKVSHNDIISKKRSQNISFARQIAMYLSRNLTGESLNDIGRAFGNKDHTSVMYACKNIEEARQTIKKVDKELESLMVAIQK